MATNTSIDSSFYMHEFQASSARQNRANSRSPDSNEIKRCPPTFMLRVIEENGLLETQKVKLMAKEYLSYYIVDFLENYSKQKGLSQPPAVYLLEYMAQRRMDFISIKKNVNSIALSLGYFAPSSYEISFLYDLFNQDCALTKVAGNYCYCRKIVKEFLYRAKSLEDIRIPLHGWTTLIKRIFKNQPISDISARLREKITTHNKIRVIETHNDKRKYDGNAQNVPLSLLSQKWDVDALYFIILCVEELNNPLNYKRSLKTRGMNDDNDEFDIVSKNVRVAERPNPYYDLIQRGRSGNKKNIMSPYDQERSGSRGRTAYNNTISYFEPNDMLHRPGGRSHYSPSRVIDTGAIDHYRDNLNYEDLDTDYQHQDKLKLKDKIALGTFEKRTALEELLWTLRLFDRMAGNHSEVHGFLQQMQNDFLTVKNKLRRTDPAIFDDLNPRFVGKYVTRKIEEPEERYIDDILRIKDKFDHKAADLMRLKISEEDLEEEERTRTKPKITPENFTQEVLISQLMPSQKWEDDDFGGGILTRHSQPNQLPGHAHSDIIRKIADSESNSDDNPGRRISRDPAERYRDVDRAHIRNRDDAYGSMDEEEGQRSHGKRHDNSEGGRTPSGYLGDHHSDSHRRPSHLASGGHSDSKRGEDHHSDNYRRPSQMTAGKSGGQSEGKSLSGPSGSDLSDNRRRSSNKLAGHGNADSGTKRSSGDPYNLDPNRDRDPNNQFGIHGVDVTPGGKPETPLPVSDFTHGLQDGKEPSGSNSGGDHGNQSNRNPGGYMTGGDASSYPSSRAPANNFESNNNNAMPGNNSQRSLAPSDFASARGKPVLQSDSGSPDPNNKNRGAPAGPNGAGSSPVPFNNTRNNALQSDFSSQDPNNKSRGAPAGPNGNVSGFVGAPSQVAQQNKPAGGNPSSSRDGNTSDNYSSARPAVGGANNAQPNNNTSNFASSNPKEGKAPLSDIRDSSSVASPNKSAPGGAKGELSSPDGKVGAKSELSSPDGKVGAKNELSSSDGKGGAKSELSSPDAKHDAKSNLSSPDGKAGAKNDLSSPDGKHDDKSDLSSPLKTGTQRDETSPDGHAKDGFQSPDKRSEADGGEEGASPFRSLKKTFGQTSNSSLTSDKTQTVSADIQAQEKSALADKLKRVSSDKKPEMNMDIKKSFGQQSTDSLHSERTQTGDSASVTAAGVNKAHPSDANATRKSILKQENPATTTMVDAQEEKQSRFVAPSFMKKPGYNVAANTSESKTPAPQANEKSVSVSPQPDDKSKKPADPSPQPRQSILKPTSFGAEANKADPRASTKPVINVVEEQKPETRASIKPPVENAKPRFSIPNFTKKPSDLGLDKSLDKSVDKSGDLAASFMNTSGTAKKEEKKADEPVIRKSIREPAGDGAEGSKPKFTVPKFGKKSPNTSSTDSLPTPQQTPQNKALDKPKAEEPVPRKSILKTTSPSPDKKDETAPRKSVMMAANPVTEPKKEEKKEEPKKVEPKKTPIPAPETTAKKPNILDEIRNPPQLRRMSPPNKELSPPRDGKSNSPSPTLSPVPTLILDRKSYAPVDVHARLGSLPSAVYWMSNIPPLPSKIDSQVTPKKDASPAPSITDSQTTAKKEASPSPIKNDAKPVGQPELPRKSMVKESAPAQQLQNTAVPDLPRKSIAKETSPAPVKNEPAQTIPALPRKSALNSQNPAQQPAVNTPVKEEQPSLPRKNSVMKKTFGEADKDQKDKKDAVPEATNKPAVQPNVKAPESKPETKPESKPEIKPESKPQIKPEVKYESKPGSQPESKPPESIFSGGSDGVFTLHNVKVSTIKTLDTGPQDFTHHMSPSPNASPNTSPQKSQPAPEKGNSAIKPTNVVEKAVDNAVNKVNNTSANTASQVNQAAGGVAGKVPANVAGAAAGKNSASGSESESERRKSVVPKFTAPKFLKK